MRQIDDEELVAYHLGEVSCWQRAKIRRSLERNPVLAAKSEEIAATLRAFGGEPAMPLPKSAMQRAWERVRPSLPVLEAPHRSGSKWFWAGASAGALGTAALTALVAMHALRISPAALARTTSAVTTKSWSDGLLKELHVRRPPAQVNQRPGPLTTAPVDVVAENPALAAHLDTAERVLTEVSHTEGALPDETRAQVHKLLLENAMYHETAEASGDGSTAAVIDDLGRVLISLDAEPQPGTRDREMPTDALRVQMNLGGVLLDLRILHHTDEPKQRQ